MRRALLTAAIVALCAAPIAATAQSREAVKDLQTALRAAGHDPNGIDGGIGPGTRGALIAWCEETQHSWDLTCPDPAKPAEVRQADATHWNMLVEGFNPPTEMQSLWSVCQRAFPDATLGIAWVGMWNHNTKADAFFHMGDHMLYTYGLRKKHCERIEPQNLSDTQFSTKNEDGYTGYFFQLTQPAS